MMLLRDSVLKSFIPDPADQMKINECKKPIRQIETYQLGWSQYVREKMLFVIVREK